MANPIDFSEATATLGPPADWNVDKQIHSEECDPLPIFKHPDGTKLISCWQLAPEELEAVKRTGVVWLWVWCHPMAPTQPPVHVGGLEPAFVSILEAARLKAIDLADLDLGPDPLSPHASHEWPVETEDAPFPKECLLCGCYITDFMALEECHGAIEASDKKN